MFRRLRNLIASVALVAGLALAVVPAAPAGAVNIFGICNQGTAQQTDVCKDKSSQNGRTNPVITALKVTISIMSFVIGATGVIMIIIAGISMVTSGGDPQKVASARRSVLFALIGLAIAALAEVIVVFVLSKL